MKDVEQFPQVCPLSATRVIITTVSVKISRKDAAMQVMNVAFIITALLCTVIGGCGYYMFGSAARDVVTFNLPAVRVLASLSFAMPADILGQLVGHTRPVSQDLHCRRDD